MTKLVIAALAAALLLPSTALGANWAVGAHPGGIAALRAQLPHATTLVPGRALLVRGARPARPRRLVRRRPRQGVSHPAVRQHGARRCAAVVPPRGQGLEPLGDTAGEPHAGEGRSDRLRDRCRPSRVRGTRPRRRVVRRQQLAYRRLRPRYVRRGRDRGEPLEQHGDRGDRVQRGAARRQGRPVRLQRLDLRRGSRDHLGREPRRARDQPVDRRQPRPGGRADRLVLARRGRSGPVRVVEGRAGRRGRRERAAGAEDALAVRGLPGGAAARDRGGRRHPVRERACLLEPRPAVRRHRRPGRPHLLDDPAEPRGRVGPGVQRAGGRVLRLRAVGVQERDRDVVRRTAGRGGRGAAARNRPGPDELASWSGSSSGAPPTRPRRPAAPRVRSDATRSRAGGRSTSLQRSRCSRTRTGSRRRTRSRRTTTPARRPGRSGRCRGPSSRRWTTGTTPSTCTRSG